MHTDTSPFMSVESSVKLVYSECPHLKWMGDDCLDTRLY